MTDKPDTMPPLPDDVEKFDEAYPGTCLADQVHAYARQHAEERCAALVEAARAAYSDLAAATAFNSQKARNRSQKTLAALGAALAAHKEKQ